MNIVSEMYEAQAEASISMAAEKERNVYFYVAIVYALLAISRAIKESN